MEALCVTLETAKKLKAAGFSPETVFNWDDSIIGKFSVGQLKTKRSYTTMPDGTTRENTIQRFAAPTAQEIADQLPHETVIDGDKCTLTMDFGGLATSAAYEYQVPYESSGWHYQETGSSMAEALAALWLKFQEAK